MKKGHYNGYHRNAKDYKRLYANKLGNLEKKCTNFWKHKHGAKTIKIQPIETKS